MELEDVAKRLAARTPGMAGADLANVCNEGALIAARKAQNHINFSVSTWTLKICLNLISNIYFIYKNVFLGF